MAAAASASAVLTGNKPSNISAATAKKFEFATRISRQADSTAMLGTVYTMANSLRAFVAVRKFETDERERQLALAELGIKNEPFLVLRAKPPQFTLKST